MRVKSFVHKFKGLKISKSIFTLDGIYFKTFVKYRTKAKNEFNFKRVEMLLSFCCF